MVVSESSKKDEQIYLGTGGGSPRLFSCDNSGNVSETVFSSDREEHEKAKKDLFLKEVQKIYSLSLSPGRNRLACGSHNYNFGQVLVLDLPSSGSEKLSIVSKWNQQFPVTSIAMVNDETVISGSSSGMIYLYDINDKKWRKAESKVSDGYILSISPLNNDKFITLGQDQKISVFSISDLNKPLKQYTHDKDVQKTYWVSVDYITELNRLLVHFPSGDICFLEMDGDFSLKEDQIVSSNVLFSALCGNNLILYDEATNSLKKITLPNLDEESEVKLPARPKQIYPVDFNRFIVNYDDISPEIREAETLEKIADIQVENLRSVASTPRQIQLHQYSREENEKKNRLIKEAKELLKQDNPERMRAQAEKLNKAGLSAEASILFAEWCKIYNKPLWELKIRKEFCDSLPPAEENAIQFIHLAALLERLNEPVLELIYYQKAKESGAEHELIDEKMKMLQRIVEQRDIDEKTALMFENGIALVQEIDKKSALGEVIKHPILYAISEELSTGLIKNNIEMEKFFGSLTDHNWSRKEANVLNMGFEKGEIVMLYGEKAASPKFQLPNHPAVIITVDSEGNIYFKKSIMIEPPEQGLNRQTAERIVKLSSDLSENKKKILFQTPVKKLNLYKRKLKANRSKRH